MKTAARLDRIPPYLFAEIDRRRDEAVARGVDIINMGIGDPDKPTPPVVLEAMHAAIDDPSTHNYPPYKGTKAYREAAAAWFERRFGVGGFHPDTEVISSIGSKEAIHNTFLAFVDPGDYTLIPDPAYPVYRTSTIFAGGEFFAMPLLPENQLLPDLEAVPETVARKAKLLWLNYPNNPTGAVASLEFFEKVVHFAKKHDILVCHDNAYSEMAYDGYKPPSILQVPGARDVAIEFLSCSKAYNMTGWRVGFVIGNRTGIAGLGQVKTNIDSGVFKAIQQAAIAAFGLDDERLHALMAVYQNRRNIIVEGLRSLGWPLEAPKATLYVWAPIPKSFGSSVEFVGALLDKCGIIVPPGNGYGEHGEGFFRIALTVPDERMREAIGRMEAAGIRFEG
ncbi:LL-diaminopimelate aminotransferase [Gloeobacter violaceus]|uniref:LL-diaminopimelate aminotransferase n=1 Tax=Gloeobacter violaceus (strain ATCC 29082 / PCC 7421) TaxID=251221 RepID=DAPAT_GLOVI|nr:LL-diaminopimelate aminotransferase [Gloeobacter violaceus]Q7NDX4.1 RecName: Full=LL-diaminopimelate aminotransferase; Short=DAP-AT; Short=DAP-aminotransferase; Short=LL-DAP-aminotransferase [Gloeobacter violaceus PCC 7421]BAC92049.1 glr4108 [Gloeobacter violaceus PCC 7421]